MWKWMQWLAAALAAVFLLGGCVIAQKDAGSLEFFFGTSLGVRSGSSTTGSTASTSLNSQPLEEYWSARTKQLGNTEGPAEVAPATEGGDPNPQPPT